MSLTESYLFQSAKLTVFSEPYKHILKISRISAYVRLIAHKRLIELNNIKPHHMV